MSAPAGTGYTVKANRNGYHVEMTPAQDLFGNRYGAVRFWDSSGKERTRYDVPAAVLAFAEGLHLGHMGTPAPWER